MEFTSQYYMLIQGILQMYGALKVTWKEKKKLPYLHSLAEITKENQGVLEG